MIKTRRLNPDGVEAFNRWLANSVGDAPPADHRNSDVMTEPFGDYEIDPSREFGSRLEFGIYLNDQFSGADFNGLMSPDCDGLWAWLAAVYFKQLAAKGTRRAEH